jgi:hypothetical protein
MEVNMEMWKYENERQLLDLPIFTFPHFISLPSSQLLHLQHFQHSAFDIEINDPDLPFVSIV